MKRPLLLFLMILLPTTVVGSPLSAQSCTTATGGGNLTANCTIPATISITIPRVVRVTVSPGTAALLPPIAADYDNGYQQALGQIVVAKANIPWELSIRSAQANFTAAGGARPNKPREDLAWAAAPGGPFTAVTGSAAVLASGNATASTVVPLYYRVAWSWALDRPGTYSLPLIITIYAQ